MDDFANASDQTGYQKIYTFVVCRTKYVIQRHPQVSPGSNQLPQFVHCDFGCVISFPTFLMISVK